MPSVVETESQKLERALQLEWIGDWAAASDAYEVLATVEDPAVRCQAQIRLARCLLETCKRGETDEAEELLVKAERLAGELDDPWLRGDLRLQQGRFDDLTGHLKRARKRYEEARELLSKGDADLTEVELILASAERRRGELAQALRRVEGISAESLPPRLRAEYLDELGAVLLARGEARRAIDVLEQALALDETTATPYAGGRSRLLLAEACMRTGAGDRAKKLIEESIRAYDRANADAGLSEAKALLGAWYEDREDYVSASHFYQEAYELDRSSDDRAGQVRAKRRLARTYRKRGDSNRAKELLADARRLLPEDDDVERAAILQEEAHLSLTGSEPDYERAINLFRDALDIAIEDGDDRNTAIAKRNLARAYRENDDKELAAQLLFEARDALEARGDLRELDDLLDDLGEVLLESDEYEQAERYLKESLELDNRLGRVSSKGRTLLLLGEVASRTGQRDAAGEYYKEALELYRHAYHEIGQSDALLQFGRWHLDQGQFEHAEQNLELALEINNRLHRPLGRVRAKRLMAAIARQRSNLDRAEDYLREARRDLGHIDDPPEQALLELEAGRLDLDSGNYRAAAVHLEDAKKIFLGTENPVDVGTCQRLLALAAAYDGRYTEALNLLEQARAEFTRRRDILELDEVYDDLGTVQFLTGDLDSALANAQKSLDLGTRAGWRRGKGRSLLLLARIHQRKGDFRAARTYIDDALAVYAETEDEVGQAAAEIESGDWFVNEHNEQRDLARAIIDYKHGRRLAQLHRDHRGAARCNRKLAHVHLERHDLQRAEDALQDAGTELRGIDDIRENAPLDYEFGRLASARGEYTTAVGHLRKALDGFNRLSEDEERRKAYQLLITAYQALGQVHDALECMREMGADQAAMYNVLVKDLHPVIASASSPSFAAGRYSDAILSAFGELEREFKTRAAKLGEPPDPTEKISRQIGIWAAAKSADAPQFAHSNGLQRFGEFCITSFALLRNPAAHDGVVYTPADAFAALSVAHWIARTLDGDGASTDIKHAEPT
jgi:tetratricopeptide (TPR) repeat protein